MNPTPNERGYLFVGFVDDHGRKIQDRIHRLVAEAFVPKVENRPVVNHINTIKTDNRASNLEWTTSTGNRAHADLLGLCPSGENNGRSKLKVKDVEYIRSQQGKTTRASLAEMFGVSKVTVDRIWKRKIWVMRSFTFEDGAGI